MVSQEEFAVECRFRVRVRGKPLYVDGSNM